MPESEFTATQWWQTGVIYQIYPRSFQDTDGNGIGDLPGITARLDYLAGLGVDALWISPFYPSPMADFGYDVANYTGVDPLFGTLADFDSLLAAAHGKNLRIILDFVPNHTSDQHPWFLESRSSRNSARRDWYIWRDAAPDGGPPNNWRSEFGGPSWTWDAATGQYYYHAFLAAQPDLNWRNPEVVEAMMAVLRFWFERGVDGFRVDAVHHLFEREDLSDNPPNPDWTEDSPPAYQLLRDNTIDLLEVQAAVAAMRRLADSYGERVMIGEAYLPIERLVAYYGGDLDGFHMPFNFHLISTPWTPAAIAALVEDYEAKLPQGGWPNWVLGNHDRSRVASRIGAAQVRVAGMLLATLRGTPTLYQGDELGLADVPVPPDQVRDPFELNLPGLGLGRDPVRAPMPWNAEPHAGFSTAEPWLPLDPDWPRLNAERQAMDPDSTLSFYRRLLAVRRAEPALQSGDYATVAVGDSLLAYERRLGSVRLLVLLDLLGQGGEIEIPGARVVISTDRRREGEALAAGPISLAPNSGLVLRIDA
jgi:alpha-glucosidase